jgi:fermentation-respiration switch protein FrsA (DUF1100 family)
LNATAIDKRVKAVATTSMYDMPRVTSKGYYDKVTLEERTKILEQMGQQRWKDAESGKTELGPRSNPEKLKGDEPQFIKDYFDYYRTPRGFHERSINSNGAWSATNGFFFDEYANSNVYQRNFSKTRSNYCRRKCTLKIFQ